MTDPPRVVVSVTTSVDGRVALSRSSVLMGTDQGRVWESLQPPGARILEKARTAYLTGRYHPEAILEGSGSFVADDAGPLTGLPEPVGDVFTDHLPVKDAARWFVVVDSRGRVRWTIKRVGDQELLVLVARATPAAYLAHLRREGISYLVVGEERVDLGVALGRLRERLGVTCVVSSAGGGLNGAMLRAGLVDELQLIVLPVAIGGRDTPALFDGDGNGDGGGEPTRLRLISSRAESDGVLWLSYEVDSLKAGSGPPAAR